MTADTTTAITTTTTTVATTKEQSDSNPQQKEVMLDSMNKLETIAVAILTFKRSFDELQALFDYIQNGIESLSSSLQQQQQQEQNKKPEEDSQQQQQEQDLNKKQQEQKIKIEEENQKQQLQQVQNIKQEQQQEQKKKQEKENQQQQQQQHHHPHLIKHQQQQEQNKIEENHHHHQQQQKQSELEEAKKPELEILCKKMDGKGLRRYVLCNENNVHKLKEEFPLALKHAPNPGKLVLVSLGRFFSLGKLAFQKNVHLLSLRRASVFILELFLLAAWSNGDGEVVEKGVKKEAERVVLEWMKRVGGEGGWGCAAEIDARGLLLFVGCFGLPRLLGDDDVWNLVTHSNLERISDELRRCKPLVHRVSGYSLFVGILSKFDFVRD